MSIPSLLILFFLFTQFAFSYTVLTVSGKRIEGSLISDQQATIVIKDANGIFLSFKKELLDLKAMKIANAPQNRNIEISAPKVDRKTPTIVEIAAATRKQRKGVSRNLELKDLDDSPQVSVFGSDSNEIPVKQTNSKQSEEHWESKIVALKKEVNRLKERRISAEATCDQTRRKQYLARTTPKEKPSDLLSTYKESSQCRKLEEIDNQLSDAERRLEDLREDARRAGVSWQTLE